MNIVHFPIEQIYVNGHRRELGDVAGLAKSIEQSGLLHPIQLTKEGKLLAGLHRIEAFKLLGRTHIPARLLDVSEVEAQIIEIEENLERNDFDALEKAEQTLKRDELLRSLGQRAGRGRPKKGETVSPFSTTADMARRQGENKRTTLNRLQIAKKLAPDVKEKLKGSDTAKSTRRLLALARMSHTEQREAIKEDKPHVAQNTGAQEWYTPAHFADAAHATMGAIDLDPASSALANTVIKATHYYTIDDDGLSKPWWGRVWLNPPYTAGLVDKFITKMIDDYRAERVQEAIVLVNNATETSWFFDLESMASEIVFPKGRVSFWHPRGKECKPLQGQAIVYMGGNRKRFLDCFALFGWSARR